MNVNDIVAERIAAARRRTEAAKRRRASLAAARQRGLARRHAAKLRNLAAQQVFRDSPENPSPPTVVQTVTVADPKKENP